MPSSLHTSRYPHARRHHTGLLVLALALTITAPGLFTNDSALSAHPGLWGMLETMTLEEKVGQLFLITIYSQTLDQADRALIADVLPGGVVLFPHNLSSPQQITQFVNALQDHALTVGPGIPLFIAVDQEGGRVTRLNDGFTRFPPVLMVGATGSYVDAVMIGRAMGQEMAAVGINMNLAPVADLQNPVQDSANTQVLYRRTISSDPELVGRLAGGLVVGMREQGVIGVLKHYPGHGAAIQDSHNELPEVDLPLPEVESTALESFSVAIENGAQAVMVGHVYYPALDPDVRRPATLSPPVIAHLRQRVGFSGLTISDAMDMGAILKERTMSEAIIDALNAGMDMIAFGPHVTAQDQRVAIADVIQAAYAGVIPEARLDEALTRALTIRQQYDLMTWSPLDAGTTTARLHLDQHQADLLRLAFDSVTVLDNTQGLLPLQAQSQRVLVLYPAGYDEIAAECRHYDPDGTIVSFSYAPSVGEIANAVQMASRADVVVVFVEDLARNGQQQRLTWELPPEKTVVVAMRSPYDWDLLPVPLTTVVFTYDSTPATHVAACGVLYGAAQAKGTLPVTVGPYEVGAGWTSPTHNAEEPAQN